MTQSTRDGVPPGLFARSAWSICDGSLEALKWIALVLMVGDHVNKYLLQGSCSTLFHLGRLAMPLFGFVLMFNLARPGALAVGMHLRVMRRLGVFALLSLPASVLLVGWWPLNILATLLVATTFVWLLSRGGLASRIAAAAVFLVGGALVEFWWPALLDCFGAWAFVRRPGIKAASVWVLGTASLAAVNGNFAALAALPLIWAATRIHIPLRRSRWVFYLFYPAHLYLIAFVSRAS